MSAATLPPWPYPFWIAHRGAGKLAPENTLAAFRLGAQHGYRAFECDVKLAADDEPFLLHDDTLDAGSWHSRAYAGEPIPRLAAIAAYCRCNGFLLDLEIKPTPGSEQHTGRIVGAAAARLWAGAAVPPLLSSFRPEALLGARETAPQLPRALLADELWPGWFEMARSLGCAAVITNHTLMSAELLAQAHTAGLRALVYTVNDEAAAQRLRTLGGSGIDGIVTDAVDRFAPAD
jgi:glycerophosphoryl diester phosphodiesterase